MHYNSLRKLLDEGKVTVGTRISSSWPSVTELAGVSGCIDYVEFLDEYAPYDHYDLENIARAAELHGMASMIKVDYQNRGYVAQRAMASGFQAVLFTDHRSARDVEETLRMIRPECPEHGGSMGYANRRWIGYRPVGSQADFVEMAVSTVSAFMIEKKEAVENIEEICAVPGVDMIQFGSYDYSLSCGIDLKTNAERVKQDERKVIAAAIKHGVRPRCEIAIPEMASVLHRFGSEGFQSWFGDDDHAEFQDK